MGEIVLFSALIVVGYISGSHIEKKHFKALKRREWLTREMRVSTQDELYGERFISKSKMVVGSVVISPDYFKVAYASVVNMFGGNISVYEALMHRAKREAVLRMKESAKGAKGIVCMRIETSSLSQNATRQIGSVAVVAYGTAIY